MMRCCNHCGALLEDDAQICNICGTAFQDTLVIMPVETSVEEPTPAPKKKLSKKAVFIACGALAVVAAIIVAVICMQIFAPLPAVKRYEAALNGDGSQLRSLAPIEVWESFAKSDYLSVDVYLERQAQYIDNKETSKERTESLEVVDWETLSEDDLDDIREGLQKRYHIDPDRVKAGQELVLKRVINYPDYPDRLYTTAMLVIAVQIDSEWYLLSTSSSEFFLCIGLTNEWLWG